MNPLLHRTWRLNWKRIVLGTAGLVLAFSLTGCLTPALLTATFRETVEVEDDPFSEVVVLRGPQQLIEEESVHNDSYFFIRSIVSKSGDQEFHQVYVILKYGLDWRFYQSATLPGGTQLDFVEIDRDVDCSQYGCTYTEQVAITVLTDEVVGIADDGVTFQLQSRSGHRTVVTVPASLIQMQLETLATVEESTYGK